MTDCYDTVIGDAKGAVGPGLEFQASFLRDAQTAVTCRCLGVTIPTVLAGKNEAATHSGNRKTPVKVDPSG